MVDDRSSPSAGWREVYDAMEADADAEDPTHDCPDCGQQSANLLRDVYECEEHGVFRASAGRDTGDAEDAGNAEDTEDAGSGEEATSGERDAPDGGVDPAAGRAD